MAFMVPVVDYSLNGICSGTRNYYQYSRYTSFVLSTSEIVGLNDDEFKSLKLPYNITDLRFYSNFSP